MKRLAFGMEELLFEDASFVPGWVQPFYRTAFWRWIRYPDDFNVRLSRSSGEYHLAWIDLERKQETLNGKQDGVSFEPGVQVFDQYANPETRKENGN
jgi:microcin C transport system substrate-binding protein